MNFSRNVPAPPVTPKRQRTAPSGGMRSAEQKRASHRVLSPRSACRTFPLSTVGSFHLGTGGLGEHPDHSQATKGALLPKVPLAAAAMADSPMSPQRRRRLEAVLVGVSGGPVALLPDALDSPRRVHKGTSEGGGHTRRHEKNGTAAEMLAAFALAAPVVLPHYNPNPHTTSTPTTTTIASAREGSVVSPVNQPTLSPMALLSSIGQGGGIGRKAASPVDEAAAHKDAEAASERRLFAPEPPTTAPPPQREAHSQHNSDTMPATGLFCEPYSPSAVGGPQSSGSQGGDPAPSAASPKTSLRTFDKASGALVTVSGAIFKRAKVLAHEQYLLDRVNSVRLAEASRRVRALPFEERFVLAERRLYRLAAAKAQRRMKQNGGVDIAGAVAMCPSCRCGVSGSGGSDVRCTCEETFFDDDDDEDDATEPTAERFHELLAKAAMDGDAKGGTGAKEAAKAKPLLPRRSKNPHIDQRALMETHQAMGDIALHLGRPTQSIGLTRVHRHACDQFLFEACQAEAKRYLSILTRNLLPSTVAPVDLLRMRLDAYRQRCVPIGPRTIVEAASPRGQQ